MSSQSGVKSIEERNDHIHLPILDLTREENIPLNYTIMNHQIIRYHRNFVPYYTKKGWKALLHGSIPTPPILPKTNIWSIPHFKTNKIAKFSHPLLICFHTPTPKEPETSFEHHPPFKLSNLASITKRHKASLSLPYQIASQFKPKEGHNKKQSAHIGK
jgi:hypothetical protein